jgi:hypothetical protein
MKAEGFIWYDDYWRPGDRGDSGHFEYHPNWDGRAGGSFLKNARDKAIVEEIVRNWALGGPWWFNLMPVDWLANMWNKAGAPCSR